MNNITHHRSDSHDWQQREYANRGCFNHDHTTSIYEDRTLLTLNAHFLLNKNSLNMVKNTLFIWESGWNHNKYSLNVGTLNWDFPAYLYSN